MRDSSSEKASQVPGSASRRTLMRDSGVITDYFLTGAMFLQEDVLQMETRSQNTVTSSAVTARPARRAIVLASASLQGIMRFIGFRGPSLPAQAFDSGIAQHDTRGADFHVGRQMQDHGFLLVAITFAV